MQRGPILARTCLVSRPPHDTEADDLVLETGALFEMLAELMTLKAPSWAPHVPLNRLMRLFGRYFQIRDDYNNLTSQEARLTRQ